MSGYGKMLSSRRDIPCTKSNMLVNLLLYFDKCCTLVWFDDVWTIVRKYSLISNDCGIVVLLNFIKYCINFLVRLMKVAKK